MSLSIGSNLDTIFFVKMFACGGHFIVYLGNKYINIYANGIYARINI